MNVHVVKIDKAMDKIIFSDGSTLESNHERDCCESHYLSLSNLEMIDFDGLEFNLTGENFFNRIEDYGIALVPVKGYSVNIPGYGYNNGYYSSNLVLVLSRPEGGITTYDITECQNYQRY